MWKERGEEIKLNYKNKIQTEIQDLQDKVQSLIHSSCSALGTSTM